VLGGITFGWFTNHTDDLIVPVLVQSYPQQYVFIYEPENVDHAVMEGFTFTVKTPPYRGLSVTLDATDLYTALDLTTGARLPNDAVFTANLGLQAAPSRSGWFGGAGIGERLVGARGPIDQTQPLFFQPIAYANLNGFIDFRLGRRLNLYVRGYNLGDERYAEVDGYPMPGRSFAVELQAR
jgi:outer membrane receptor protein involved in Fe transport